MIVKLEEDLSQQDIEVLIKYAKMNPTVKQLETIIKSVEKTILCTCDTALNRVKASDIFYIESVDKQTFVYCEAVIYHSEQRLYQLLEELSLIGFVQVSKSCILNINVLESIRPLINSRMEATLSNGERIYVTRKYIRPIRKFLEEREYCYENKN